MKFRLGFFLLFLLFILLNFASFGQAIETEFGKNRVQFHNDYYSWSKYETENVITYWYGKARNIAQATIQIAELEHNDIQELLEYRMNDKIELIVFTDITDVKQSNIGNEEIFNNTLGETKTVGKKAFIYFDGNHKNLRSQIRQGIASVYINNIITGSNLQEVVQNALLLNLPDWFQKGLVSYADESWNTELDHQCKFHLTNEKMLDFDKYSDIYPREAGHSLWYFLENTYGRNKISQLIYITRIYRSLEGSFPYVLNQSFENIKSAWARFYIEKYNLDSGYSDESVGNTIYQVKKKHNKRITAIDINPQGSHIAIVVNELGRQDVELLDVATGETKRLLRNDKKNPFQAQDVNYPLMTWHPNGESLFILYEKNDIKYLVQQYIHDLGEFEIQDIPENFQRIYSMDYVDGNRLLFSGTFDGFSDLFYYKIKSRSSERITEDFWDDLDATYVNSGGYTGILFSSNRQDFEIKRQKLDTILPIDGLNVFFLEDGKNEAIRLTNNPSLDHRKPRLTSDNSLYYLQDRAQKTLLFKKEFLGTSPARLAADQENYILDLDFSRSGSLVTVTEDHLHYSVTLSDISGPNEYILNISDGANSSSEESIKNNTTRPTTYGEGKQFQSRFSDPEDVSPVIAKQQEKEGQFGEYYDNYFSESLTSSGKRVIKFEPYRANAARLKFRIFDYSTNIDNEPLFEGLETYSQFSQSLQAQPTTIHSKAKIKDIFENYTLTGGLRIPTSFNGSEVYLTLDDDKKRWDKSYTLYRKLTSEFLPSTSLNDRFKRHTILGRAQFKYPFNIFGSVRLTASLRFDKAFFSITDLTRLEEPFTFDKRLQLRAEYIYDNTYDVVLNVKNGTRYKVYLEAINGFDLDLADGFNFDPSKTFTSVIGFDARHYIPVFRKAVLALRGTGAASFGSHKMLYYLGGMENWILSQFDNRVRIPEDVNYSYVAIAPHLRGFDHNIRNGGSYLLSNIEFRLPVFTMLFGNKIKNGFIRNFQMTGFFDAGLAWHGFSPFSDINPLNEDQIVTTSSQDDILVLNITYFRDPLAYGFGWGARSTFLGYYVKFDYAYGIETGIIQSPKWYISLGFDF